jgi:iron complex outermembrane receptor protein
MGPFSSTALGVQIQHKQFSALGEGADYLLPTSTKSAAVFGFTNAPLGEKLSLQLAARIERASVEGTPLSGDAATHHFTPSSGSVGLVFDPTSEVRLGLTASSAARAPAQTELFARGPHDGPGTLETGDPNLNVERANSIEGSLRWHRDAVRLEASIWGARFQDYIYGALTGRTCDDDGVCVEGDEGELRELIYGQSGATFYGTEGKLLLDVYRAGSNTLQLTTLADYVHATLSNGTYVPRIPPYHIGAGLTWQGTHFDAGFLAKYFGSHTEIATAETPTGGFFSLEANATWRPIPSYPHLQLSLIGHNLTDSAQRNSVALNKDLVLLPGRDIKLLFHLDF